jgi:hypothetical protein
MESQEQRQSWLILIIGRLMYVTTLDFVNSSFSIAAVPSFPGLRHFPEGHGFKQWTGDDSKALMKVLLCRTRHVADDW